MRNKVVSAAEAAALIKDGDTLTTSGFVGIGVPDELLAAIETRFLETGHPRDLSLVFAAGQGDGKHRGLNRLGHEGLLKRVIGGHERLQVHGGEQRFLHHLCSSHRSSSAIALDTLHILSQATTRETQS